MDQEKATARDVLEASVPGDVYDQGTVQEIISQTVELARGLGANMLELKSACDCISAASAQMMRAASEAMAESAVQGDGEDQIGISAE